MTPLPKHRRPLSHASEGSTQSSRGEIPYTELAKIYDRVYSWKDYAKEARILRSVVRKYGPPRPRRWLDVACGTGAHLRYLSRTFDCVGLDESGAMLSVARSRVPTARFFRGRMPEFDVGRRFDVVTCLFSAIGYVRTEAALRATLRTFARHLAPGGILLVEPWLTPSAWRPGSVHLWTVPSDEDPIARMNSSKTLRGRSVMEMHYLVASRGHLRHWRERHDMGLFSVAATTRAFRAAGMQVQLIPSGFYAKPRTDRGLYVAKSIIAHTTGRTGGAAS
ncbi:MAG: class I SAM-dependent methyltransferase [Thermoplasmata archaeon]